MKKATMADRKKLSEGLSEAERGATTSAETRSHDFEQPKDGLKTIFRPGESYPIRRYEGLRQSKRFEKTTAGIHIDVTKAKAAPESAKTAVNGSALHVDPDLSSDDEEEKGVRPSPSTSGEDMNEDDADDPDLDGTALTCIPVTGPQRGPGGAKEQPSHDRPREIIPGGYHDPVVAGAWPVRNQIVNFMYRQTLKEIKVMNPRGCN